MSSFWGEMWVLTNIYGPCTSEVKVQFIEWFRDIDMPNDIDWILLGDFNLIRYPHNRNKLGGGVNLMLAFNEAISNLRLTELPLNGQKYTWTNKQENPLLQGWIGSSPQHPGQHISLGHI